MHNSDSSSSSVSLHSVCCFIVLRRSCPLSLRSLLRPRAVAEESRDGFTCLQLLDGGGSFSSYLGVSWSLGLRTTGWGHRHKVRTNVSRGAHLRRLRHRSWFNSRVIANTCCGGVCAWLDDDSRPQGWWGMSGVSGRVSSWVSVWGSVRQYRVCIVQGREQVSTNSLPCR